MFYSVALVLLGVAFARDLPDWYRLQKYGKLTQGTISQIDRANHGHIAYEFKTDQRLFQHVENASSGGLICNNLRIGVHVPVRFLADRPEISVAGSARQRFNDGLGLAIFGMFGIPVLILLAYFRQRRS